MNLHMTFDPLFQDLAFSLSLFLTSRDEASLHSGHISELVRIKEVHPISLFPDKQCRFFHRF